MNLNATLLLVLLGFSSLTYGITCPNIFPGPAQGNGSGSQLSMASTAKINNVATLPLPFSSQAQTPFANGTCPASGNASRACTISGNTIGTLSPTVLSSSSSVALDINSGGTLNVGGASDGANNRADFANVRANSASKIVFDPARTVYRMKQVEIFGGSTITFAPGDYHINGFLHLDAGSKITFSGSGLVRLFISGNITVNASGTPSIINSGGAATRSLIYATSNIAISGGSSIVGAVYAKGSLTLHDASFVTGTASAKTMTLNSTSRIDGVDLTAIDYLDFCNVPPYTLSIAYSSNALTCAPLAVTVTVLQSGVPAPSFAGSIRVSSSSANGEWGFSGGGSINNTGGGTAEYTFPASHSGSASLLYTNKSHATATLSAIITGDANGVTGSSTTFRPTGFMASAPGPRISNKPFNMTMTAVTDNPATPGCDVVTSYAGNKTIKFWASRDVAGVAPIMINGVAAGDNSAAPSATTVPFAAGVATVPVRYADAGSISIFARDDSDVGAPPLASADELVLGGKGLVVSPLAIVVEQVATSSKANPGGSAAITNGGPSVGAGFAAAGAAFGINLRAVAWQFDGDTDLSNNMTTPSFAASTTVYPSLHSPISGSVGALASPHASGSDGNGIIIPAGRFSAGVAPVSLSYGEYGSIRLTGGVVNYLASGSDVSITSSPVIGRFYPDRFSLNRGDIVPRTGNNPTCNAAHLYMDDPGLEVDVEVLALGVGGNTLSNYSNGNGTLAAFLVGAENNDDGLPLSARLMGVGGEWSAGAYRIDTTAASFSKLADLSPDGPYQSLALSLTALSEPDGANLQGLNSDPSSAGDCSATNSCTAKLLTELAVLHARIGAQNNMGSEVDTLALPIWIEHWNGSHWRRTETDNCSRIRAQMLNGNEHGPGNFVDIPIQHALTVDGTYSEFVIDGRVQASITGPGTGNVGYVLFAFTQDGDLLHLTDKYDGAVRRSHPDVYVAFGYHRGNDRVIYRQPL